MPPKKAKSKAKHGVVIRAAATAKNAAKPTQAAPVKKKKKHDPLRPQPAWLFPPDEENPILNPRGKSKEEIQKEIDERLAAIKFLEHKSVTAPVKTAPPSELLQLIGAFFASYGFVSTGRIFSLERNARRKLDGWNDQIGEKKFAKNQPDLVKIFKDWRADWEGESDAETSSSGEDFEGDVAMNDAESDSDDSSDGSSEDEKESVPKSVSKSNGVKIRTTFSKLIPGELSKNSKASLSSSSGTSESESESGEEQIIANPPSKAPANTTTKAKTAGAPESSSESSSASDSSNENKTKRTGDILSHIKQISIPPPSIPQAASDSSSTLKGHSPSKEPSPSESSSSASSLSQEEEDSSSSDSSSEVDQAKKQSPSKSKKASAKRKASPSDAEASDTAEIEDQPSKKLKATNETFSRIPKDTKIDPRLASNKYVSYDYADKAHRDLVMTKGKGFTKEKNKKKRGA